MGIKRAASTWQKKHLLYHCHTVACSTYLRATVQLIKSNVSKCVWYFLSLYCICQSMWRRWSVCGRAASPSACVGLLIPFPLLSASHWCFVAEGRVWTCAARRGRRRSAGSGASELLKIVSPTWARRRSSINILQLSFQLVGKCKVQNLWNLVFMFCVHHHVTCFIFL